MVIIKNILWSSFILFSSYKTSKDRVDDGPDNIAWAFFKPSHQPGPQFDRLIWNQKQNLQSGKQFFQLFLTYDLDFQTCIFTNIYMQKLIFISIIHMVTNLVLEWSWETRGNVYIYCCIILHGLPQSHTLFPFLEYSSRPMFTPMGRAFGTRLRQLRKQQPCILCCKRCNLPTNKRPKIQTSMYCKICSNYFCQNDSRLCMISPWGARRRSCYGEAI